VARGPDLTSAGLATLLDRLLDTNHATLLETWAVNHLPADGLTPVAFDAFPNDEISPTAIVTASTPQPLHEQQVGIHST
jgi:hypothetical protein